MVGAIELPADSISCHELVEITQVVEQEDVVNNANATVTPTCPANTDVISRGGWTVRARDTTGAAQLVAAVAYRLEPWECRRSLAR